MTYKDNRKARELWSKQAVVKKVALTQDLGEWNNEH